MADFCVQCWKDTWGDGRETGRSDFGRRTGREPFVDVCEGCGVVVINERGECCGTEHGEPCAEGHLSSWRARP